MNTIYITDTGRVCIDDAGKVKNVNTCREAINKIIRLTEDAHIVYNSGKCNIEKDAKAGDIVITFYETSFPNKVVVINNDEWSENLIAYDKEQQALKEKWASENKCECDGQPICKGNC